MEPITLPDGRVITAIDEDKQPSDLFFTFQNMASRNADKPGEVVRWLMMRLFLVDGEPLTLDHLSAPPPVGIGMRAIGAMNKYTNGLIAGVPDPKASSGSVGLLGGG